MNFPLITVILPTHNRSKYLVRMVESILKQDYPNFEILIFDDCSTDDTEDVVRFNYSFVNCIKYIKRKENLGSLPNAAKAIIDSEIGDWVILVGDDDVFACDNYFSEAMSLISMDDEIVMVCSNFYGVRGETQEILKSFNYSNLFQKPIEEGKDVFLRNRKFPGHIGGAAIYKSKILKRLYQDVSLDNLLSDNQTTMCSLFYGKVAFIDKYPYLWTMDEDNQNFSYIKKDDRRNIGNAVETVKWIYQTAKNSGKISEEELYNYLNLMFVKIYYRLFNNFSTFNTDPSEITEYIKNKNEEFTDKLVKFFFNSNKLSIKKFNKFAIYGTGDAAFHLSTLLNSLNKTICYYIDDFRDGDYLGVKLYKTRDLNSLPETADIYIIAAYNHDKEEIMRIKLIDAGVDNKVIYTPKEIFAAELNNRNNNLRKQLT